MNMEFHGKYIIWTCIMHPRTLLQWLQGGANPNVEGVMPPNQATPGWSFREIVVSDKQKACLRECIGIFLVVSISYPLF
jgi:hypothetical protein